MRVVVKGISLRDVREEDRKIFFEHHKDVKANAMAAFTAKNPNDREAFETHWDKILNDPAVNVKTILVKEQNVGHIASFVMSQKRQVTYWIAQEYWGQGMASEALSQFLVLDQIRPIYASAASDNIASLRVLQKNGFVIIGHEKAFANARGCEIEETILVRSR